MKAKLKTRYGIIAETVTDIQEINTIQDLEKTIASAVTASQAWLNGIEIVNNGYVHTEVYNRKEELLEALLTGKEINVTGKPVTD